MDLETFGDLAAVVAAVVGPVAGAVSAWALHELAPPCEDASTGERREG